MAHRSDIVQVNFQFPEDDAHEKPVADPICGAQLSVRDARHLLFRGESVFSFCSRECLNRFLTASKPGSPEPSAA